MGPFLFNEPFPHQKQHEKENRDKVLSRLTARLVPQELLDSLHGVKAQVPEHTDDPRAQNPSKPVIKDNFLFVQVPNGRSSRCHCMGWKTDQVPQQEPQGFPKHTSVGRCHIGGYGIDWQAGGRRPVPLYRYTRAFSIYEQARSKRRIFTNRCVREGKTKQF